MFCDIVCPLHHKDWHAAVDLSQFQHKAIWTRLHLHTHKRTSLGQSRRHISQWTVSSDSLSSLLHYLPSNSSCLPVDGHWHHVRLHFLWQNPLISKKEATIGKYCYILVRKLLYNVFLTWEHIQFTDCGYDVSYRKTQSDWKAFIISLK